LLDTHIWVRWLVPVHPLPAAVVGRIEDADRVAVSAISCWEVGMLVAYRRIDLPLPLPEWIGEATVGSGVEIVPIQCDPARLAAALPQHHRDPADRIIIATAQYLDATLISLDERFPAYFLGSEGCGKLVQA
jgi:PIN domain nuclease of toxin-antitoxin system